jgi:hypothetical protein
VRAITVKLSEETLERLGSEARAKGKSIAAVVRSKLDAEAIEGSVYERASDLVGVLAGSARSASNARRRFRRK